MATPTFPVVRRFGQHAVLEYDTHAHPFRQYMEEVFGTSDIERVHLGNSEFQNNNMQDMESSLHKKFYASIKSSDRFRRIYCGLIRDLFDNLFSDEDVLMYQSYPSIRIQFPNNTVVPPHYDSDDIGKHPIGERNFLLPVTPMSGSRRLFIESEPRKGDFAGIDMNYGELLYFNGNKCTHYNELNTEPIIRISFDFRIITKKDYLTYINSGSITTTNPRDPENVRIPTKMIAGGYYQIVRRKDSFDDMLQWHYQRTMLLQSRPCFGEEEALACYNYMREDNFVTEFQQTEELERRLSEFIGTKHCIMTTSGNIALVLTLMALGVGAGDEVIVPNYTMIASVNSIRMTGATPIIVDVSSESLTLSLDEVVRHITPKTKAVMHVSLNNRHCGLPEIADYCRLNNISLVEDAAQSLGCRLNGKHMGTIGKVGCFSLSTPKIISTGQGGFMVTDDDEIARQLRMIKNFGRVTGGIDVFEVFGLNAKFTDIQAVIGIEQVKKLPERVNRLREIYDLYYSHLSAYMKPAQFDGWIPWFVDIFVEDRDSLMAFLKIHNIQTRATYPEINKTPMYDSECTLPISAYVSSHGLFLPTHMKLTNGEIEHICKLILLFLEK
jgi:perosamine synthetase